jgi:hypothetical protein
VPSDKSLDLCSAGGEGSSAEFFLVISFRFRDKVPFGEGWVGVRNRRGCSVFSGSHSIKKRKKRFFIGKFFKFRIRLQLLQIDGEKLIMETSVIEIFKYVYPEHKCSLLTKMSLVSSVFSICQYVEYSNVIISYFKFGR